MDARIEAAPMGATAVAVEVVLVTTVGIFFKAFAVIQRVVSIPVLSLGGTSLSAVSPDTDFIKREVACA